MQGCQQDVLSLHKGLIIHMAKKYHKVASTIGIEFEELLSEGYIGLLEAYSRYDETKSSKLSTYATIWIKKKILNAINKRRSVLSGTEYVSSKVRYEGEVNIVSLDSEYEENEGKSVYDRLHVEGDYELYQKELENRELAQILKEMITKLPKEYRDVIKMRYGIGIQKKSLSEIAQKLKCSKKQVYRIEKEALEMLRVLAKKRNLHYFLGAK